MSILDQRPDKIEYYPCRYGGSRMTFRGPRKPLDLPYVACLGGSETFGLGQTRPYPLRLEAALGRACVNLGVVNGGIDLVATDPAILSVAQNADVVVVQIVGAQNLSNRFYSVHPRRNDRFLRASDRLIELYPDVDFTEYHFNRHLMHGLEATCPDRFAQVLHEVKSAWVARMKGLLERLNGQVVLLWFAPGAAHAATLEPLHVDSDMLEKLSAWSLDLCEVSYAPQTQLAGPGLPDAETVARLPDAAAHTEAADRLMEIVPLLLAKNA